MLQREILSLLDKILGAEKSRRELPEPQYTD